MFCMSVSISVVVRQGHVLQSVMLRSRRIGMRQAVGWVRGQAIGWRVGRQAAAGTEALTGAHRARPFGQMFRVQAVSVAHAVFGPDGGKKDTFRKNESHGFACLQYNLSHLPPSLSLCSCVQMLRPAVSHMWTLAFLYQELELNPNPLIFPVLSFSLL